MRSAGRNERGQGLIEFALILPVLAVLLLGILEFGSAFNHQLSLEYATREGARHGAALVNGGGDPGCGAGQSPNAADVDPLIIEAVERVLTSPGSPVAISKISEIRIYRADANGDEMPGLVNVWTYTPGAGPVPIDSTSNLDFSPTGAQGWDVCTRSSAYPADAIGVGVTYTYDFLTGLSDITAFMGLRTGPNLTMNDHTAMALEPTGQTAP